MKRIIKIISVLVIIALLIAGLGKLLLSQKVATYIASYYELQGVDVSHFQGDIDWEVLKDQGISFAYIKATEGSGHVDTRLDANYQGARESGILYGFYHFLSLESAPETQMENFMAAVGEYEMDLVPAIDVEWYGNMRDNPPDKENVLDTLTKMVSLMEDEFGQKPVIYTTQSFYNKYLKGADLGAYMWIRNVYFYPVQDFVIWQYTDRAVMDGYTGQEKYIDRDVIKLEDLEKIRLKE
ncbi:GH25 family lysozyme [Butyrivibrio fibrisolvens]|jgi:lysozyme|uniref:Lysozyme n=1 Tax=Butyrivibrio fibrisolvens TaxID=831 RepID=A0A1H9LPU8_BUTFI|nr:GH25 family lysozyme [Butyrivibrio fibrisolvens]SER13511.1 lysozyme [Butyrivibrio fibrisolvens]